jgi:hypothetical protein
MKRLKDEASADVSVQQAVVLLSAVTLPRDSQARRSRIYRAITGEPRTPRLRWWRHLVVAAAVFALTALASAAMLRARQRRAPGTAPAPSGTIAPRRLAVTSTVQQPEAKPTALCAPPHGATRHRAISAPSKDSSAPTSPAPVEAAPASDLRESMLVRLAVTALRQDHDPDRAGDLLEAYRRDFPAGALAEEALALAIEAAIARSNPDALRLADEYLSRFPAGRFRAKVIEARERFAH